MQTLDELLTGRSADAASIGAPSAGTQVYTYDRLRETSYSMASVLAAEGVEEGGRVAIAPIRTPETIVAFLGTALVGATAWFGEPQRANVDALVAPTEGIGAYEIPPDAGRIGYGPTPDEDRVRAFERAVWEAPDDDPGANLLPNTKVLTDGETVYSHRNLLKAAHAITEDRELDGDLSIVIRAPLTDPRTVAGSIVTAFYAGTNLRHPGGGESGDLAVTDSDAPESRILLLRDVPLK